MAGPFQELLLPGENLLTVLEAGGDPAQQGKTLEEVWYQVGVTPGRLLIVRMVRAQGDKSWSPSGRMAGARTQAQITQFPRTAQGPARLVIDGLGPRIALVGVDSELAWPQLQQFLLVWGATAGSAIRPAAEDNVIGEGPDQKMLMYAVGAIFVMCMLCCGCTGLIAVVRVAMAQL